MENDQRFLILLERSSADLILQNAPLRLKPCSPSFTSRGTGVATGLNIGAWKTHQSRLMRSTHTWVEYHGTAVIRKIWGGRACMGEIEADGPAGHLEILSLRLYNPHTHQWSFNVAVSPVGVLNHMYGEFKNESAAFLDQEPYCEDKIAPLRISASNFTPNSNSF